MNHHPDHDWLERYAAGTLPLPLGLCIGTHLSGCADCRREVETLQRLAATLFAELAPGPVTPQLRERILAAIELPEPATSAAPAAATETPTVPAPLRQWAPAGFDRLAWTRLLPGVSRVSLPGGNGWSAALLRVAAGGSVPHHDHSGLEMTVVLRGGFSDRFGSYGEGDLIVRLPGEPHLPHASDEECVCLISQAGPLQFTGRFWRLLNPLLR